MPVIRVKASAAIAAPAVVVYELIADYRHGHPAIIPPRYFEDLQVLEGGRGAGTRIRFVVKAFGSRQPARARITEPDPGRVLVETDETGKVVTTFTVDPQPDGRTRVTIASEYRATGLRGLVETLLVPGYLRKVYVAELNLLARHAMAHARAAT
jgi:hypothetical protein